MDEKEYEKFPEPLESFFASLSDVKKKPAYNYIRLINQAEQEFGTHIYDADLDTFKKMMDIIAVQSRSTNRQTMWLVRSYVKWAIESGISKQKSNFIDYYNIRYNKARIIMNYLMSYEDLSDCLERLLRDDQHHTVDIFHKNYCELMYIGFTSDEISELRKDQVDFSSRSITAFGRTYKLPGRLLHRLAIDVNLKSYEVIQSGRKQQRTKGSDEYLLSPSNNTDRAAETMRELVAKRLVVAKKSYSNQGNGKRKALTLDHIFCSGCMDRAVMQENQEEFLISDYRRAKSLKDTATASLLKDFSEWKLARL